MSLRALARRSRENFVYENANRLELHSIGWRFRFRFTYNSTNGNRVPGGSQTPGAKPNGFGGGLEDVNKPV